MYSAKFGHVAIGKVLFRYNNKCREPLIKNQFNSSLNDALMNDNQDFLKFLLYKNVPIGNCHYKSNSLIFVAKVLDNIMSSKVLDIDNIKIIRSL